MLDPKSYTDFLISALLKTEYHSRTIKYLIYVSLALLLSPVLLKLTELQGVSNQIPESLKEWFDLTELPYNLSFLKVLFLLLFWVIFFYLLDKIVFWLPLRIWSIIARVFNHFNILVYHLKQEKWPDEWEFQGATRMESYISKKHPQLVVSYSNSGSLLNDTFFGVPKRWKNFKMEFKLIFPKEDSRALGIIFRAEDLSNYYMLQIRAYKEDNYKVLVKPHIRYFGDWEVLDIREKDLLNIITHESTTAPLSVVLKVKDSIAQIAINGKDIYRWPLATNTEINYRQHDRKEPFDKGVVPKITFSRRYGKIGFRAYPNEEAIVRDLRVNSI